VPYFGICFGMQMAVHRGGAQSLAGIEGRPRPSSARPSEPVVGLMTEWVKRQRAGEAQPDGDLGGTMRLGAYEAKLVAEQPDRERSMARPTSRERHRHRYEVNMAYREVLEAKGGCLAACRPMACCRRSLNIPTIRGSSACSSTPS
jgi:CTP synthase